jgi:hypothetical protein
MPTKTFQWKIELVFMLIQKSVTHETGLACIKANKLQETIWLKWTVALQL